MKLSPKGTYHEKQKTAEGTFYIVQQNNLAYPSVMNKDQFESYCNFMKMGDFPLTVREGRFESFKQVQIKRTITDTEGDEDRKCPKCGTRQSYHEWRNNKCARCDNTEEELRLKAAPPAVKSTEKPLFPFKPGDKVRILLPPRENVIGIVKEVPPYKYWEPKARSNYVKVTMPDGKSELIEAFFLKLISENGNEVTDQRKGFPFKPGDTVRSLISARPGQIFYVLEVNPGEDWEPGSRHACITVQMPDGKQGLVDATEIEIV